MGENLTFNNRNGCSDAVQPFVNVAEVDGDFRRGNRRRAEPVSARATFTVDSIDAELTKCVDKEFVLPGETLHYAITFTNNSSVDLFNVRIRDNVSSKTRVNECSIEPRPQSGESLQSGICIGCVPVGQSRTLTFSATVRQGATGEIENTAFATFSFTDHSGVTHNGETIAAHADSFIAVAELSIEKFADRTFVMEQGEEVVYTLLVTNTGSVPISHIVVTDTIPQGMAYKRNSTIIDNERPCRNENPENGIHLSDLQPGECHRVQFTVTVL